MVICVHGLIRANSATVSPYYSPKALVFIIISSLHREALEF